MKINIATFKIKEVGTIHTSFTFGVTQTPQLKTCCYSFMYSFVKLNILLFYLTNLRPEINVATFSIISDLFICVCVCLCV